MRKIDLFPVFAFLLLTFSCKQHTNEEILQEVLSISKGNRVEFERVLEHYKHDSLKLEAARFLIGNMPGNISFDSTNLYKYRPILYRLDSLRELSKTEPIYPLGIVNKEWPVFIRDKSLQYDIYSHSNPDLFNISSDYLIKNIDQSFAVWQKTLYKDSVDFNTYLHYLLPYRRQNGYIIESWRDFFLSRYETYIDRYRSPHQTVDSLLDLVTDYQVNGMPICNYPFICLADYNLAKISRCAERCWFNSMFLSALGVPCTIDYVPAWGNRNSNHEWNAIVIDGKTHAFEATGGRGKWKSQLVYNNVWVDEYWMKSRLPKVFRYSYESVGEGPYTSKKSNSGNTPSIFLHSKYKDVSVDYFETSDIKIPIKEDIPEGAEYAYLFVFNNNEWRPVYWGKICSSKVLFERMGRDIVYLPAFYSNKKIVPFNDPFVLTQEGEIRYLHVDASKKLPVTLTRKYYARPDIDFWRNGNAGARFEIADGRGFTNPKTVFTVPSCESRPNTWKLEVPVETRYLRYYFPENLDVLAELAFYTEDETGELIEMEGSIFSSEKESLNELKKLFDKNILSYSDLNRFRPDGGKEYWLGIDFGKKIKIAAISLCPRNDKNNVIKGTEYELFYWDNKWVSLGRQVASDYNLKYSNVPANSLLLLKSVKEGVENRIFTWENGEQKWW